MLNTKLHQLLAATGPQSLASLKKLPRDFSKSEIGREIKLFDWVRDIAADTHSVMEKLNLSQGNVAYYGSMVEYYSITQLRAKNFETVALYLVCYLQSRLSQIQDTLVAAFIFQVRKLAAEGKAASRDKVFEALASIEEKVKQAGPVLRLFVDEKIAGDTPFQKVRKRAYQLLGEQDIPVVSDEQWLDKDRLIRESRWSALQISVELLVQQKLDALHDKLALVSDRLNTGANESVVLKT